MNKLIIFVAFIIYMIVNVNAYIDIEHTIEAEPILNDLIKSTYNALDEYYDGDYEEAIKDIKNNDNLYNNVVNEIEKQLSQPSVSEGLRVRLGNELDEVKKLKKEMKNNEQKIEAKAKNNDTKPTNTTQDVKELGAMNKGLNEIQRELEEIDEEEDNAPMALHDVENVKKEIKKDKAKLKKAIKNAPKDVQPKLKADLNKLQKEEKQVKKKEKEEKAKEAKKELPPIPTNQVNAYNDLQNTDLDVKVNNDNKVALKKGHVTLSQNNKKAPTTNSTQPLKNNQVANKKPTNKKNVAKKEIVKTAKKQITQQKKVNAKQNVAKAEKMLDKAENQLEEAQTPETARFVNENLHSVLADLKEEYQTLKEELNDASAEDKAEITADMQQTEQDIKETEKAITAAENKLSEPASSPPQQSAMNAEDAIKKLQEEEHEFEDKLQFF